jgi:hypothetical protein
LFREKHIDNLVDRAKKEIAEGKTDVAWALLEEAHIVSQPMAAYHMYVHWQMLLLAWLVRDYKEIFGQIVRFLVAAPGSIAKRYPIGNTGRSNVNMFKPMPIPGRIAAKIEDLDSQEKLRLENGGDIKESQRTYPLTRR